MNAINLTRQPRDHGLFLARRPQYITHALCHSNKQYLLLTLRALASRPEAAHMTTADFATAELASANSISHPQFRRE